ncbi:MAG TPA: ATP-binding protein, partial [Pseudomonadota bacterium]|nr:ATP-binding protein [Pseudomonadota bacterium]
IDVEDDGPGIPEAQRGRIFEPFMRLEAGRRQGQAGCGLGLSIVRRIVERHGGSIELDRSPLGGARFRLLLPAAPAFAPNSN